MDLALGADRIRSHRAISSSFPSVSDSHGNGAAHSIAVGAGDRVLKGAEYGVCVRADEAHDALCALHVLSNVVSLVTYSYDVHHECSVLDGDV